MTPYGLVLVGVILFIVACAFLAAELFFPSHGLLGVFAAAAAVGGVVAMFMASQVAGVISAVTLMVLAPVVLYWAIKLYPQSPVGKRVMLDAPEGAAVQGFTRESASLASLAGKRGVATTFLRPAGACEIEGQRIDCVSEAEVIPAGTSIEVVRVIGLRVIVKPAAQV